MHLFNSIQLYLYRICYSQVETQTGAKWKQQQREKLSFIRKQAWAGPGSYLLLMAGWLEEEEERGGRTERGEQTDTAYMQLH